MKENDVLELINQYCREDIIFIPQEEKRWLLNKAYSRINLNYYLEQKDEEKMEVIDKVYKTNKWRYNFDLYPKCKKCGQIMLLTPKLSSSIYKSFNELVDFILKLPLCSKCKIEELEEAHLTLVSYRIGRYGISKAIKQDLANKYLSYCCCSGSDLR